MWVWLLLTLVAIFSIINFIAFLRLLKKHDDSQILIGNAFELMNADRIKISKEIEELKKRSKILSHEARQEKRIRTKDQRSL